MSKTKIPKAALAWIKLNASYMDPWTTKHFVCPVCSGGHAGEVSFNLTVEPAAIKFICHRASCGVRGVISDHRMVAKAASKPAIREFNGTEERIPELYKANLEIDHGILDYHLTQLNPTYAPEYDRVIYPVYGYDGKRKGRILRSYSNAKPKTLTYRETDSPTFMAWYMAQDNTSRKLVVVEDVLSAVRASKFANAVALLGTHMSLEDVREIRAFCKAATISEVILALDEDAFRTALDHADRYKLMLPMKVVKLEADLKDSTDEVIERVLK